MKDKDGLYTPDTILIWKPTGELVKIIEPVFLSDNRTNFLHYNAYKKGKKGMWAVYPADLEEIPPNNSHNS